jgi:hypothetical protein
MKTNNGTISQVIYQSVRAMVTIIMFGGMTALFINGGSGIFEQSLENFENARDLLTNLAS